MKTCLNCKKEFKYKHTYQKYCSYECSVQHRYYKNPKINYYCKDCKVLISKPTALIGKGRCRSCSRKGKLSWSKKVAKKETYIILGKAV